LKKREKRLREKVDREDYREKGEKSKIESVACALQKKEYHLCLI